MAVAFRSDLDAAHARAQALEGEVAALEAENAELRGETEPEVVDVDGQLNSVTFVTTIELLLLAAIGLGVTVILYRYASQDAATGGGIITALVVVGLWVLRGLVEICPPGFVIVLSGRSHPGPNGSTIGYRVVTSGRVVRMPVLETANLLDCRPPKD